MQMFIITSVAILLGHCHLSSVLSNYPLPGLFSHLPLFCHTLQGREVSYKHKSGWVSCQLKFLRWLPLHWKQNKGFLLWPVWSPVLVSEPCLLLEAHHLHSCPLVPPRYPPWPSRSSLEKFVSSLANLYFPFPKYLHGLCLPSTRILPPNLAFSEFFPDPTILNTVS